ncbi:hypothetical protein BHM03_00010663 [Ensete ventricosum]|nr:hypothetical protein BHM03_00010663 [Ensete ventricosum]
MASSSGPSRKKELAEWQVSPPAGFKHKVTDNLQRCCLGPCSSFSNPVPGSLDLVYSNCLFVLLKDGSLKWLGRRGLCMRTRRTSFRSIFRSIIPWKPRK